MKKYLYQSATACHTVIAFENGTKEISFYPGEVYELPAGEANVKRLVALQHLTESQEQKQEKKKKQSPNPSKQ